MQPEDPIKPLLDMVNADFGQLYDADSSRVEKKFQQKKDGWCGPAALSYALAQQGFTIPQTTLARLTKTTVKNGVDPKHLLNEARRFGFNAEVISGEDSNATIEVLDQNLLDGKSAIVDYLEGDNIDTDGHYVVYQGSTGGKIIVWDPSKGRNIVLDKEKFVAQWKDKTVGGRVFKNWAMILSRPV